MHAFRRKPLCAADELDEVRAAEGSGTIALEARVDFDGVCAHRDEVVGTLTTGVSGAADGWLLHG
jgi:hypothetical protein